MRARSVDSGMLPDMLLSVRAISDPPSRPESCTRMPLAPFSIVVYPKYVRLFFLDGADLPDPDRLLEGSGKIVRSIVVDDATVLDRPAVKALMAEAIARGDAPFARSAKRRTVIRSVVKRKRPRR